MIDKLAWNTYIKETPESLLFSGNIPAGIPVAEITVTWKKPSPHETTEIFFQGGF